MTSQASKLKKKIKYVKKADFQQIDMMMNLMVKETEPLFLERDEDDNPLIRFTTHNGEHIEVKLTIQADFPRIVLKNFNEQGEFVTQVHLFFGEAIKFMKYLNTRFQFHPANLLKERTYEELSSDNFF